MFYVLHVNRTGDGHRGYVELDCNGCHMVNNPSLECNFLFSSHVQGVGEGVMRMILILNAPAGTKREQTRT